MQPYAEVDVVACEADFSLRRVADISNDDWQESVFSLFLLQNSH